MGGAMSWVSERNLVAAISNAGGFGIIACGSLGPKQLREEIVGAKSLTVNPFGVNLITMHPELDALIELCVAERVSHVVLAGGVPPNDAIRRIKDGGGKVMCFAPAVGLAKRLVRGVAEQFLLVEASDEGVEDLVRELRRRGFAEKSERHVAGLLIAGDSLGTLGRHAAVEFGAKHRSTIDGASVFRAAEQFVQLIEAFFLEPEIHG